MTTFTRIPLAYWADRVGFPILMSGIGLFILILILVKGQDGLGSLENVLSLLLSLALVIFGIFFFVHHSLPVKIEIDAKDVRIFYLPKKTITIQRKDVIRAKGSSNGMHGGTSNSIAFQKDGKIKYANIMAWYRKEDGGTIPRDEINDVLNLLLNINNDAAAVNEAKLRKGL